MNFNRRDFCRTVACGAGAAHANGAAGATAAPPNILRAGGRPRLGDLGCYNSDSAIPTPRADRFAGQGVRFTDMHSPSAVCKTRYRVLTGRYCWRSRLKQGVLEGYSPSLIERGRLTLPGLLRQCGYYTAGLGKWHLGLGDRDTID